MEKPKTKLLDLPDEVLEAILWKLGADDLHFEVAGTCWRLRNIIHRRFHPNPARFHASSQHLFCFIEYCTKFKPNISRMSVDVIQAACPKPDMVRINVDECRLKFFCQDHDVAETILKDAMALVPTVKSLAITKMNLNYASHWWQKFFICLTPMQHLQSVSVQYFDHNWHDWLSTRPKILKLHIDKLEFDFQREITKTEAKFNVQTLSINEFYCRAEDGFSWILKHFGEVNLIHPLQTLLPTSDFS